MVAGLIEHPCLIVPQFHQLAAAAEIAPFLRLTAAPSASSLYEASPAATIALQYAAGMLSRRFQAFVVFASTSMGRPKAAGPPSRSMMSEWDISALSPLRMSFRYLLYRRAVKRNGMKHTDMIISHREMSERSERLKRAMENFGYTQAQCVERWGWNTNTLKSNLNGNMDFSFKRAQVYGAAFKVRAEWLYTGTPPMLEQSKNARRPSIEIPVLSWVAAGRMSDVGDIAEIEDAEKISVGGLPAGNWFATDVRGDSMDRIAPEGARIIVRADDRTLISGAYYVFGLRGETTFKRYYDSPVRRLEPYSTNPANRTIYLTEDEDWIVIGRVLRSIIDLE